MMVLLQGRAKVGAISAYHRALQIHSAPTALTRFEGKSFRVAVTVFPN